MSKELWEQQQERFYEEADEYFFDQHDIETYVDYRNDGLTEEEARRKVFDEIYHAV